MHNLLFTKHAQRFTPKAKKAFRNEMISELESLGYNVTVDRGLFATNLYFGNIDSDQCLVAHYDTPTHGGIIAKLMPLFGARIAQIIAIIPFIFLLFISMKLYLLYALILFISLLVPTKYNYNDNSSGVLTVYSHAIKNKDNNDFFYILTDNEEKGLLGAIRLKHYLKKRNRLAGKKFTIVDCVGTGDYFAICGGSNHQFLNQVAETLDRKISVMKMISKAMASDHLPLGKQAIMISKVNPARYSNDVYLPNIHTSKDNLIDLVNIDQTLDIIDLIYKK